MTRTGTNPMASGCQIFGPWHGDDAERLNDFGEKTNPMASGLQSFGNVDRAMFCDSIEGEVANPMASGPPTAVMATRL